ncbi:MAG TPA: precorrin-3B C(17)-methyltransferase [Acidimicrobiales bacterium]|nr:precorrin-3B C(17)-methyltransferase [Acidimicrobiales bacterium]
MRVLVLSVTEPGRALARRLPYEHHHGSPGDVLAARWGDTDAFVVILALGATVRLIAPLLGHKDTDPAVVCVDDAGRFAIPVVGGHHGANELAGTVAALLGAEPVLTTATDALGVPALDRLPGFQAHGDLAAVTGALISGQPVRVENPMGWPLPDALAKRLDPEGLDPSAPLVAVRDEAADPPGARGATVVLVPRSLVVGVGTTSDATVADVEALVNETMAVAGLSPDALDAVATIDRRAGHPAVVGFAAARGLPIRSYPPALLGAVAVPHPSEVVDGAVGTPSVAEAASLLAAGAHAELAVTKQRAARATVAVARRAGPAGGLSVVGLGPGGAEHRTPAAERAVRHADTVIGYQPYVEQCADLLTPGQEVLALPIGAELDRARVALERAAAGARVALVCSGDAGIYAMASPVLELAATRPDFAAVDVVVVPGVTAGLAAAAVLGAPLGHDHLVVSLSDLLTPWEHIEARLTAAAETDLVLVVYNPRSQRRTWQIDKARAILLARRSPDTPVGVVTDAGRAGQHVELTTLGALDTTTVTMTTCLVVGSSATRIRNGRMVTPRGYLEEPGP